MIPAALILEKLNEEINGTFKEHYDQYLEMSYTKEWCERERATGCGKKSAGKGGGCVIL